MCKMYDYLVFFRINVYTDINHVNKNLIKAVGVYCIKLQYINRRNYGFLWRVVGTLCNNDKFCKFIVLPFTHSS